MTGLRWDLLPKFAEIFSSFERKWAIDLIGMDPSKGYIDIHGDPTLVFGEIKKQTLDKTGALRRAKWRSFKRNKT